MGAFCCCAGKRDNLGNFDSGFAVRRRSIRKQSVVKVIPMQKKVSPQYSLPYEPKNGISVDFVKDQLGKFEEESIWTLRTKKGEENEVWMNNKGSFLNAKEPVVKAQFTFSPEVTVEHILEAMYNRRQRRLWDDNIYDIKILDYGKHPNTCVLKLTLKPNLALDA